MVLLFIGLFYVSKVIKAADTLLYEKDEVLNQDLLVAQFSIQRYNASDVCKTVLAFPPNPYIPTRPTWHATPQPVTYQPVPPPHLNSTLTSADSATARRAPPGPYDEDEEGGEDPNKSPVVAENGASLGAVWRTSSCYVTMLYVMLSTFVAMATVRVNTCVDLCSLR
jgi:hypothetical protein